MLPALGLLILPFSFYTRNPILILNNNFFSETTFSECNSCRLELPSPWTIDCEEKGRLKRGRIEGIQIGKKSFLLLCFVLLNYNERRISRCEYKFPSFRIYSRENEGLQKEFRENTDS